MLYETPVESKPSEDKDKEDDQEEKQLGAAPFLLTIFVLASRVPKIVQLLSHAMQAGQKFG